MVGGAVVSSSDERFDLQHQLWLQEWANSNSQRTCSDSGLHVKNNYDKFKQTQRETGAGNAMSLISTSTQPRSAHMASDSCKGDRRRL